MSRLQDLDIPKEYKKKKKLSLYKAFILKNGDTMNVHRDIDILSFNREAAVQFMVRSADVPDIIALKGTVINFAVFEFNTDEILTQKLIDEGEIFYEDLSVSITLRDKIFKIDVEDYLIEELEVQINPKNEIKTISNIKLIKT